MAKKQSAKTSLEDYELAEIAAALKELRDADYSTPSDTESALDSLASVLLDCFFEKPKDVFWGRTPSLHQIVKELDRQFSLDGALISASSDLEDYAEDAYEDEFNEFVIAEIQASAEAFCEAFAEFITEISSE